MLSKDKTYLITARLNLEIKITFGLAIQRNWRKSLEDNALLSDRECTVR